MSGNLVRELHDAAARIADAGLGGRADDVERWLAAVEGSPCYRWLPQGPGVPLASGRADLILERALRSLA